MSDQNVRNEVIEPSNNILTSEDAIQANDATREAASGHNSRRQSIAEVAQMQESNPLSCDVSDKECNERVSLLKGIPTGAHGENYQFDSIDERVDENLSSEEDRAQKIESKNESIEEFRPNGREHSESIDGRNEKDKFSLKHWEVDKDLPALNVTTDPNLKSCLSLNSECRLNDTERSEGEKDKEMHPLFYIKPDSISPNLHGLLSRNSKTTPVNVDRDVGHTIASPIVSSNSNSAISSAPNSPPLLFQSRVKSPPISRANSLRYTFEGDKRVIDAMKESNNDSVDSGFGIEKELEPDSKLHLLIGITGCISVHKNVFLIIEKLFELYTHEKLEIQVVLTEAAEHFLVDKMPKFESLGVKVWFHDDLTKYYSNKKNEKNSSMKINANVLYKYMLNYELVRWTDVFLIAPLSANTLAKMINGLCDDLLNNILRIWPVVQSSYTDGQKLQKNAILTNECDSPKSIIAALALTSAMYSHPITKNQIAILQDTYPNISILKPVEKFVDVDGNISMGGMRSWREVVDFVSKKLGPPQHDEDEEEEEEEIEEKEDKLNNSRGESSFEDSDIDSIDDDDDDSHVHLNKVGDQPESKIIQNPATNEKPSLMTT